MLCSLKHLPSHVSVNACARIAAVVAAAACLRAGLLSDVSRQADVVERHVLDAGITCFFVDKVEARGGFRLYLLPTFRTSECGLFVLFREKRGCFMLAVNTSLCCS